MLTNTWFAELHSAAFIIEGKFVRFGPDVLDMGVALLDVAAAGGTEARTELVVFHAEERSVALFESERRSKEFGDTVQEIRVECEALLVLFTGLVEYAKCEHVVFPSAVHRFVFFRESQTSGFELG